MSWKDSLIVKNIDKKEDHRGYFELLADGDIIDANSFGSLIVSAAVPGQIRGNHWHAVNEDYAAIIQGEVLFVWEHIDTGERYEEVLTGEKPKLIYVPIRTTHAMKNIGKETAILIEYSTMTFKNKCKDIQSKEIL